MATTQFSRKNVELYSLLFVLGSALVLAFFIIKPYLNALLVASVAAIVFEPLYRHLLKIVGRSSSVAALLSILILAILVISPLLLIGQQVFEEARGLYTQLESRGLDSVIQDVEKAVANSSGRIIHIDAEVVNQSIKNSLQYFAGQTGSIFSGILNIIIRIAISIFALYYFLKDNEEIRRYFLKISPLSEDHTKQIIHKLTLTIRATIRGSILVALVQALLLGLGLIFFGIPSPFLWSSVGFISALVPALGTTLITIPIALFLLLQGNVTLAIAFFIWGSVIVGLADNLLRPRLMGRDTGLHPFLVFMSVIGGLSLFGPLGILWGPIILSLLTITLESYQLVLDDKRIE